MARPTPQSITAAVASRAPTWRPVLPSQLIDRSLMRGRGGVYPADPDVRKKAPNYSLVSIERTRTDMRRLQAIMDPPPRDLRRQQVELPNCTGEWLSVPQSTAGRVILYFHGGAFLRGSTDTHIGAITRFMRASHCECFSVDYRRAPEVHYPAWVDDAVDAYRHLVDERGIDPSHIALGGDSAGGSLVLALIQRIAELDDLEQPAAAFIVSPWADLSCSGPSHQANVETEVMFGRGVIEHCAGWLAEQAGVTRDHPLFSPAFGTYPADAPPLRIDVSAIEQLQSDAHLVESAYSAGGAHVELHEHPSTPHAWTAIGTLKAARQTCRAIGTFVDTRVTGATRDTRATR